MGDFQRRTTHELPPPERKPDRSAWRFALFVGCVALALLALLYLTRV
jgi:hypothetical protein